MISFLAYILIISSTRRKVKKNLGIFLFFAFFNINYETINLVKIKMYKEKLRELREEKNIKQSQLSLLLNIHEYGYGQYEREYVIIPIKHLVTLSNNYSVSLDYIFGFTTCRRYENMQEQVNKNISGQRLKEFRKDFNLTQVKLAKLLNIGKGTIADYERGRYLIATPFLYMICSKYHVSADYLLGKTDNPKYLK